MTLSLAMAAPAAASDCLVIAHRGASGYLPEHTLAAYSLAIELGADYIEPDLILTKDGVPVARHENILNLTTNVAGLPEFADRKDARTIGTREFEGWFSEDFTLAEIRRLRATERYPDIRPDSAARNGEFAIATLAEVIALVHQHEAKTGRRIGLYPEIKQPAYFAERGLDAVGTVLAVLEEHGYDSAEDRIFLQSFDAEALRAAAKQTDIPLVQLFGSDDPQVIATHIDADNLREVASYAAGIGVPKYDYLMREADGKLSPTPLLTNARSTGLVVHAYTFRAENHFLPGPFQTGTDPAAYGRARDELRIFLAAGLRGFFTDQPDIGRQACDEIRGQPDKLAPFGKHLQEAPDAVASLAR